MKPKMFFRQQRGNRFAKTTALASVISLSFLGASAEAAEHTYRYYRFVVDAAAAGSTQLSEFDFSLRGNKLNLKAGTGPESTGAGPVTPVTVSGGTNGVTTGEGAEKLLDGSVTTKMFSGGLPTLNFDFATPVTIDSFNFATANDSIDRTPTAWKFQGSNDGTTFVTLLTRTTPTAGQLQLYGTLYTYQSGFELPALAGTPSINSISATTPAIIAAGGTTSLTYDIGGTPTSVILNPGNVDITATPTFTVTPTETTTYTVTATNATGTAVKTFDVRVVAPETANYRYVRFTPLQTRVPNAGIIQVGELELYSGTTKLTGITATNPGGRSNPGEGADKIVDGSSASKWLDFNKQSIVLDLGTSQSFDSYQIFTGNDASDRDPVRWILEGSSDSSNWATIEIVGTSNYPIPNARGAATGKIPLAYAPLTWTGTTSSEWNTIATNFAGPSAYTAGRGVLFDDTAANKTVTLTEQLQPTSIAFSNTTDTYTLGGAATYGNGSIIKNGAGSATLTNINSLDGAIIVNKGKLTAGPAAKALGEINSPGRLFVRDGGEFEFTYFAPAPAVAPYTLYNQRAWTIENGLINVRADTRLVHNGPIQLTNTFTKTGTGTLVLSGLSNSNLTATNNLIVNAGVVEFPTGYFNNFDFLGGTRLFATVNNGGTLRGTTGNAFGGDYLEGAQRIGQFRINEGGTFDYTSGIQYLSNGLVNGQGRLVLNAGTISGAGQLESARGNTAASNADASDNARTIISSVANALPSQIIGTGAITVNTGHLILDVAEGAAADDLVVSKVINGNYGIIKQGEGNLTLTNANIYAGRIYTYFQPVDNPTNADGYNQALSSSKVFDLPNGTTVRAGTLTLRNTTGSATGTSPALVLSGATLAGAGTSTSPLTIQGTISPGDTLTPIGTLNVGATTISGTYNAQVNGTTSDKLVVTGNLNITGRLVVSPTGDGVNQASTVIATYTGTRTGTFATTTGLPTGYSVVYDDVASPHEIRLVADPVTTTGYDGFIDGTTLTGADALPTADPDADGLSNLIEFVIGGNPEVSSQTNAPTVVRNANGDFVFTFTRTQASAYLNPAAEYSTSLIGEWTTAADADVVVTENTSAGVDTVVVTLPSTLSADGKLFVRLKAVLPSEVIPD